MFRVVTDIEYMLEKHSRDLAETMPQIGEIFDPKSARELLQRLDRIRDYIAKLQTHKADEKNPAAQAVILRRLIKDFSGHADEVVKDIMTVAGDLESARGKSAGEIEESAIDRFMAESHNRKGAVHSAYFIAGSLEKVIKGLESIAKNPSFIPKLSKANSCLREFQEAAGNLIPALDAATAYPTGPEAKYETLVRAREIIESAAKGERRSFSLIEKHVLEACCAIGDAKNPKSVAALARQCLEADTSTRSAFIEALRERWEHAEKLAQKAQEVPPVRS